MNMHEAIKAGDVRALRGWLESAVAVEEPDKEGNTLLHQAARHAHTEIFQLLLDAGANVHALNKQKMSVLFVAAAGGVASIVQKLIDKGADVEHAGQRGLTPLFGAIINGHAEVVRLLLEAGADPDQKDGDGNSPLQWAKKLGHTNIVELIEKKRAGEAFGKPKALTGASLLAAAASGDVDTIQACLAAKVPIERKDGAGFTPLMRAAERHRIHAIQVLLAAGADPYAEAPTCFNALLLAANSALALRPFIDAKVDLNRGNTNRVTPLMFAAQQGFLDCVKLLVEEGVDLYLTDRHGRTALERAQAHKKLVNYLRERMGTKQAPHGEGQAPSARAQAPVAQARNNKNPGIQLGKAAKKGDVAALQEALAQGAPIDWRNRDGNTPLMVAAENGQVEAARALLAAGADVHARVENTGADALYYACAQGAIDIVKELLARGAAINPPQDDSGTSYTPLMAATLSGKLDLVKLLVEKGADVHAASWNGETALKWARQQKEKAIVSYLKEVMGEPKKKTPVAHAPGTPVVTTDPTRPMQVLKAIVENFPIAATEPNFQSLLDLLNGLTRRRFLPSPRRPGVYVSLLNQRSLKHLAGHFQLPAPTFREEDVEEDIEHIDAISARLQDEVAKAGYLLTSDSVGDIGEGMKLWLYPTGEKYAVLAACGTNGANYGHSTRDVIAWLQNMEKTQPFLLTECGKDRVAGRFLGPVQNAARLLRRMVEFCPDIEEGESSPRELARLLEDSRSFYFWWD